LSEMALEEYGDLGRLIKEEKYYLPTFVAPDFSGQNLTAAEESAMRLNALKRHRGNWRRWRRIVRSSTD
jgi:hypothetical protein